MAFSPDSFDRLLADKLAQTPEPIYEPAHWDQLEDQLQHLNHALQQAAQVSAPAPAAPVGAPLTATIAKAGFATLLAGLTVVNGYFFYAANEARNATAVVSQTPIAAPATTAPVATPVAVTEAPSTPVDNVTTATPAPRFVPVRRSASPVTAPVLAVTPPAALPVATTVVTEHVPVLTAPAPAPVVVTAPAPAAPRPDSSATQPAEAPATRIAEPDMVVHNIITPGNRDGLNDRFELPVPIGSCRLTILDRNNRVVYSAAAYDNTWDGGTLPAGDYLYLFGPTSGPTWYKSGQLTIQR